MWKPKVTPDHCQINGSLRPGVPPAPGAGGRSWKVHAPVREKPGPVAAEPPTKARAPEGDGDRRSRGPCALVDCTRAAWGAWWGLSLSLSGLCTPHSCPRYTHAQTHAHTCTHRHRRTQMHTCAGTHSYKHVHTDACRRTHAHACMHVQISEHST